MNKIIYFIEKANEERPAKEIVRDMKKAGMILLLGKEKTEVMEKEESIARAMNRAIFYRPYPESVVEMIKERIPIFPEHQRRQKIPRQ